MTLWTMASVAVLCALAVSAPTAGAATPLGVLFPPTEACVDNTYIEVASGGNAYAAPSAGVLTSWQVQTGDTVPPFARLKVARPNADTDFTIVGESARETLTVSGVNTFPTRIPVAAGDTLGIFWGAAVGNCGGRATPGYTVASFALNDAPVGTNAVVTPFPGRIPVGATLEPDADNDGYGDETQDLCPSDADTQRACRDKVAPETSLTKKTVKGKKATFEFSSSEPGTSFRCSIDGKPFEVCASPRIYKAKPGKHSFYVFGKDAAGNVDDSPATTSFKIKRKPH
jgi:hypothetical protein